MARCNVEVRFAGVVNFSGNEFGFATAATSCPAAGFDLHAISFRKFEQRGIRRIPNKCASRTKKFDFKLFGGSNSAFCSLNGAVLLRINSQLY
jgi:hypothetical protein